MAFFGGIDGTEGMSPSVGDGFAWLGRERLPTQTGNSSRRGLSSGQYRAQDPRRLNARQAEVQPLVLNAESFVIDTK